MAIISVSILDLDFMCLEAGLARLKSIGVTHIHLDIVDTTFARNISFGPGILNRILEQDFVFDLHFMIADPLCILEQLDLGNVKHIAVHHRFAEVRSFIERGAYRGSVLVGLAVSPDMEVPDIDADFFLVMTVHPGFGGQRLLEGCLGKIAAAKRSGKQVVSFSHRYFSRSSDGLPISALRS